MNRSLLPTRIACQLIAVSNPHLVRKQLLNYAASDVNVNVALSFSKYEATYVNAPEPAMDVSPTIRKFPKRAHKSTNLFTVLH